MNDTANILLVDDNPRNLELLGKVLKGQDYNLEFAVDGPGAIQWSTSNKFDLILLDINMPGMDGFETCRRIRSAKDMEQIPIIFLTAEISQESILKGFEAGAQDYVTKPFASKELVARVKTQLELKRSRDVVSEFSEQLKTKNKLISDSINYAHHIQRATQRATQKASSEFSETFSLSLPKDIVSGDFSWFYKINNYNIAGVFDCTGHGVPGAFMSILGITLLNEIVIREAYLTPDQILGILRDKIIASLDQNGAISEMKDGMDGAIICFDHDQRKLTYAGANSRSLLLRNGNIIELKGDRMSISYNEIKDVFSLHELPVVQNDVLYLFSDGYVDQFGGPRDKKFGIRQLKNLLVELHEFSMADQKKILLETHRKWKGEQGQIDDIMIVGIRF